MSNKIIDISLNINSNLQLDLEEQNDRFKKVVIKEKKVDTILIKSNLPIVGYSINPYVGCEYCYATFMKRFTEHKEDWKMFLDVKMWDKIKNPEKYKGKTMIVGSVTDGYNYFETKYDSIIEDYL